jgi:hypothetical protein
MENAHKEEMLKIISELPIDKEYVDVKGMFIPLADEVILLPVNQDTFKSKIVKIIETSKTFGIIHAIGPDCRKPLHIGMRVMFDPKANTIDIVGPDGRLYLFMMVHNVFCAVTPESHILPMSGTYKTKLELRNEERFDGMTNANKRDIEKLQLANEKTKKIFPVTKK